MTGSWQPFSAEAGESRLATPVELRPRGRRGAELVRLRLPDRPGSLAAVTSHLSAFGVDVLGLEIVDRSAGMAIDDFVLAGPLIDDALARIGGTAIVLARRPGVELRDSGLAMAAACEDIASARGERDAQQRLVYASLDLVFAEAAVLCVRRSGGLLAVLASTEDDLPAVVDGSGPSLIASALFSGECLTADGRIPWAPPALRDRLPRGPVAVIPGGPPHSLVLALIRDDDASFVLAELDRLAALIRVASQMLGLHETTVVTSRIRVVPALPPQ